jgi:hypothetical protein
MRKVGISAILLERRHLQFLREENVAHKQPLSFFMFSQATV